MCHLDQLITSAEKGSNDERDEGTIDDESHHIPMSREDSLNDIEESTATAKDPNGERLAIASEPPVVDQPVAAQEFSGEEPVDVILNELDEHPKD